MARAKAPGLFTHRAWVALGVVITIFLLVIAPGDARATSFYDVTDADWFSEAVQTLAEAKIVAGREDGTFRPYDPVTRAEFAVLVARSLNLPPGTRHPFTDFPHGVWFEPAVASLYAAGLASGRSWDQFAPYSTITRQQAVTLTVRALAYRLQQQPMEGVSLALRADEVEAWLLGYSDRALITEVHRFAAANAYRLQLLAGQSETGFRPVAPITRGETAALLYAALFQTPIPLTELPIPAPQEPATPLFPEPTTPSRPGQPALPEQSAAPSYQPASVGSRGPHVLFVEQRLAELTYRPGPVDGVFDERTRQAVIAFQKWEKLAREGTVGPETWARLLVAGSPRPRLTRTGIWIEVDLARQVFLYIQNGVVARTLPTSTGASFTYRSAPYTVERKAIADGPRYRALYLNPGNVLAIHGYPYVPTYPASHGCVRLTKWDMDDLRAYDASSPLIPDGTEVYIY